MRLSFHPLCWSAVEHRVRRTSAASAERRPGSSPGVKPACLSSRSNPACAQCLSVSPQEEEDRGKRQVLVLGLDGAGKSSMLQGLNAGESAAKRGRCRPTRGFNFMSLNVPACQLDFLESKAAVLTLNTLYPPSESGVGFLSQLFQNIRACQRISSSRR